jgi:error-prone DNA polymerase
MLYGLVFMTARVIITPDFYDRNRMTVLYERFVLVSGSAQNQDEIIHLKARAIEPLTISTAEIPIP